MGSSGVGCCLRLREMLSSLSPKERQVASYVLECPEKVVNMTIEEIATQSGTSASAVVRLCKSMGYSGYKELCRMLSSDLTARSNAISYQEITPGDQSDAVFRNICLSNMKAIENTMNMLDAEKFEQAVQLLCRAKRVDFYGVGTSALVALDAHNKFLRTGKMVMANADYHVQLLSAASLKKNDVAVLISYSGETYDIIRMASLVKRTGCKLIAITSYTKNSLSKFADVILYTVSAETMIRSGAISSRIAQLTIIDALYTAVCSNMYDSVKSQLDKTSRVASMARPDQTERFLQESRQTDN